MEKIVVYNSLTREKTELKPLEPGKIRMYACGVTVYDHCHIGHAMQAIFFDTIRRYLRFAGYAVTYVRNYTDVDDKIINRAQERGLDPNELATAMIRSSEADMAAIGVESPDHAPCVSTMIPEIIAMIETLIQNGAAYATPSGDVYYHVSSKADYGKLSNVKVDQLRSGTRVLGTGDEKRDELDFALWKADTTKGACWPSPWGIGRPGWHIECSAMSLSLLGKSFDIHGGGRDLIFPHHENEVAQSESANQAPFASYWLHCGLLTIQKQKMSKSLGNRIFIQDFVKNWPAEVLRIAILEHHYRSNIDFSDAGFQNCLYRLIYYYKTLQNLDARGINWINSTFNDDSLKREFCNAMNDDFNSAQALGVMNNGFRRLNAILRKPKLSQPETESAQGLARCLSQCMNVFGLLMHNPAQFLETLKSKALTEIGVERTWVESQIAARKEARTNKDFASADAIRKTLQERRIELMDTPTGTDWTISVSDQDLSSK